MKSTRGWRGDKAEHARVGALGGKTTVRTHGNNFYARIGSTGGSVSGGNFKRNRDRAIAAGRKGGKAKKKRKAA